MSKFSYRSFFNARSIRPTAKTPPTFRSLRLESLENRELLSVDSAFFQTGRGDFPNDFPSPLQQEIAKPNLSTFPSDVLIGDSLTPAALWTVTSNADDGSENTLRYVLANAAQGDTISFASELNGATISLNGSQLSITKGVTIDAASLVNGITIDANDASRVLNVVGSSGRSEPLSVRLSNLNLTGGKTENGSGGGVYASGNLNLELTNCSVLANFASVDGGGLYLAGSSTRLAATDCVFENNVASGDGGGLYLAGTATLERCSVVENSANYGGGFALETASANLTFKNGSVSRNEALSYGGGSYLYATSRLTLENSFVSENSAVCGGGFYNRGTLTVTNAEISRNASSCGGGIYNSGGSATATNCSIVANVASETAISYGGGIYNSSSVASVVTLNNCVVAINSASVAGNDVFQNVSASGISGTVQGSENLSGFDDWSGTSENNFVYDAANPLFNDPENGDYSLPFDSQAVDRGDNAAAVYSDGSSIQNDLAGKNRVYRSIVDIGAYEYEPAVVLVTTELDLVAPDDELLSIREAIAQAAPGDIVRFDDSLAGKTIALNGTPVVVDKPLMIDAITIYDMINDRPGLTIDAGGRSTVMTVSGGLENSPVWIAGLSLTGGKNQWYGGLLSTEDHVAVLFSRFDGGFAYYGGAIANEGNLSVASCEFTNNRASHGAAVFNRSSGVLNVSASTATSNVATNYGGVLYNNGTATVAASEFISNRSENRAGAIYVADGSVAVSYSTFDGNSAKNNGGALYNAATCDLSNCSIFGGSSIYGGGVVNYNSLTVSDCVFSENSATQQGGAIYHSSSIAVNITGGSFSNNSANQGGGLFVRIGTVRLTGVEMKSNSATHNGGAIYSKNQVVLTDCVVAQNSAKYYGGGIYNEKIVRLQGTTSVSGNSTESGKSMDIHTKTGGQVIISSQLADSVFDETADWTIEL